MAVYVLGIGQNILIPTVHSILHSVQSNLAITQHEIWHDQSIQHDHDFLHLFLDQNNNTAELPDQAPTASNWLDKVEFSPIDSVFHTFLAETKYSTFKFLTKKMINVIVKVPVPPPQ